MDNYERTIDLVHVFNYVKYNLKKIVIITLVFALLGVGLVTAKNIISHSEELYYSTTKILFKFNECSTSENDYSLENRNFKDKEKFFSNCNFIFATDEILIDLLDEYNLDINLTKFKENIIVENIPETDVVRIIAMARTPQMAEGMLNIIVSRGVKSVENLYDLKSEIIDKYTYTDKPFNKLEVDSNGQIELSYSLVYNMKHIFMSFVFGLIISVMYFVFKCVFNNKVESVDFIEEALGLSTLQVLGEDSSDYSIVAAKLINNNKKQILFAGVTKNDCVGKDIVEITKTLLSRNRKSLIMCVESETSATALGIEVKEIVSKCGGIDIVYTTINDFDKKLNELESEYDFILVETNSAGESSDSLLLSKNVESTVLVNKCNTVSYEEFRRVVSDLNKYGNGVTGVILKGVTRDSSSYIYVK